MSRADQFEAMQRQLEERILAVLADLPAYHTLSKREIQKRTYGTDTFGASHIYSALGRLKNRHEVIEVRRGVYRLPIAAKQPEGAA